MPLPRGRVAALFLLSILTWGMAGPASSAQLQSWVATARIRSGNSTLTSSPSPGSPTNATDSTGFLEANGANIVPPAPIDAGAIAEFDLPNGTLAAGAGFDAAANFPDSSLVFDPFGGGSTTYLDDITVDSGTLAPGTPVTVRFVFASAFSAEAISSLDLATTAVNASSTAAGVQGLAGDDNRYIDDLDNGIFIQNGLFTAPYTAEYTVDTTVGATFPLAIALDADSFGTVRVTGSPGNEINHTANAWMNAALAFGGEVVAADAQLVSGLLGGPFPPASLVSVQAAEAALPANPFVVPEPGASASAAAALACVGALRGIRRRALG